MATAANFWLQNPTGQNTYDGSSFSLNPYQYASQEGTQFASANIARLLGSAAPSVYNVAPTAGPYQMPGQATFGGEGRAADGTMLGGMNAGQVARLYSMYPKHVADQMIADELRMLSGGAINPTVQMPGQGQSQGPSPSPTPQQPTPTTSAAREGRATPTNPAGTASAPTPYTNPFGTPTGASGATWTPGTGTSTPQLPGAGAQPRPNPFAGLFGASPSTPGAPASPWQGRPSPYNIPQTPGASPYTPAGVTPRQNNTFSASSPGAGQFMYNPASITSQSNPVFAMLQNVLGLRSAMNRPALNLGQPAAPAVNALAGNYRTTQTPGGYTRWQSQGG